MPQAQVLQCKGKVDIQLAANAAGECKMAECGKTVQCGQTIICKADCMALLTLTAGQYLIVNMATKASVTELTYSPSGPHRSTAVKLEKGALFSQVRQPRQGTTAHKVSTPFGELSARGTAWSTQVGDALSAAVYGGVVVYNYPGIVDIDLPAGAVATLTGAPGNPVLKVVNLVTGRITIYRPGQQREDRLLDARELAAGARSFEAGISSFNSTATDAAQVSFGQLSTRINQTLASNGVAPIANGGGALFPRVLTAATTQLADTASPESATPNP